MQISRPSKRNCHGDELFRLLSFYLYMVFIWKQTTHVLNVSICGILFCELLLWQTNLLLNYHHKHESGFHGTTPSPLFSATQGFVHQVLNNEEDRDSSSMSFYFHSLTWWFCINWNKFLKKYKICCGKYFFNNQSRVSNWKGLSIIIWYVIIT